MSILYNIDRYTCTDLQNANEKYSLVKIYVSWEGDEKCGRYLSEVKITFIFYRTVLFASFPFMA